MRDDLTNDEKVVNCLLALMRWDEVPPRAVVPSLGMWTCGTQACFGGHLATWPEFWEMGVRPSKVDFEGFGIGEPTAWGLRCHDVARRLFGSSDMFMAQGMCDHDDGTGRTAHAVVVNRLESQIVELTGEDAS